jgi:hypothetical protein
MSVLSDLITSFLISSDLKALSDHFKGFKFKTGSKIGPFWHHV